MKKTAALFLCLWIILGPAFLAFQPVLLALAAGQQTDPTPEEKARQLMAEMTPEEKVGQLFLITFKGRTVDQNAAIYELIKDFHIGGVVLSRANDNFTGPEDTLAAAYTLTAALQQVEWDASQKPLVETTVAPSDQRYIPLFIGIAQEGDQFPYDQILSGVTPLPNLMAIGATWKPDLSRQAGSVLGAELHALGFNLYLGPSLDVLDLKNLEGDDLGTRTFGGDPYWVGVMGRAFIQGLHEGSGSQLAVIAKHFPGRGGSDRQPEKEVATVRKSLEQLKQIELEPFFTVTGRAADATSAVDGLLVSHIRYQGFQGNIRATTRPVSFDQTALETILALPDFLNWRTSGVVVSDDIGSEAVRKFFDPAGNSFDIRQVARSALLAGNDLIYVDNFLSANDPDAITSARRTLNFFAQKYREDTAFAERVDASVLRLLTLKYKLYPTFDLEQVVPPQTGLTAIGKAQQTVFDLARSGVTLISPSASDLANSLPEPPQMGEGMVFITDVVTWQQCSKCVSQASLDVETFENAVLRLYGPRAGGQVSSIYLSSYSFNTLRALIDRDEERSKELADSLTRAEWVVIASLNEQQNRADSLALQRLLSERPELLTGKKVIVFAFNAPYYLDATDISKVTAYYGIYSKAPAYIEVAARILFQELTPASASPVSIPGIGYDLIAATSPDPAQVIPLMFDLPVDAQPTPTPAETDLTPQPTPVVTFKLGDTIPLKTGVIIDHNRHMVPDGTPVRFIITVGGESGVVQQVETVTKDGVAKASYRLQAPGTYEFRVVSDQAVTSEILRLEIIGNTPAAVTEIVPTATPTPEPTSTPTPTPTPTVEVTPPPVVKTSVLDWSVSILALAAVAGGVFILGRYTLTERWGARWGSLTAMGGLLGYLYLALGLPGSEEWLRANGTLGVILVCLLGAAFGWLVGGVWYLVKRSKE